MIATVGVTPPPVSGSSISSKLLAVGAGGEMDALAVFPGTQIVPVSSTATPDAGRGSPRRVSPSPSAAERDLLDDHDPGRPVTTLSPDAV